MATSGKTTSRKAAGGTARKKAASKKSARKKTTRKKAAARKTTAKKAVSKKASAKRATAKKTTAKKAAAKRPTAKKAAAKKKTAAKKATVKKATAKKATAKKAAPAKRKAAAKAAEVEAPAEAPPPAPAPARKKAVAAQAPVSLLDFEGPDEADDEPERFIPEGPGPHAHPDAGLSKAQVTKLHELLKKERNSVLSEMRKSVHDAVDEVSPFAESIDQAQHETEQNFRLRLADKQRKLLAEIDAALQKMDLAEYGVCEGTEDPIGYARLEVRPWARYSVEYKELKDRRER